MSGKSEPRCRLLSLIQLLISCYDWISFPFYYIYQRPWNRRLPDQRVKAKLENPDDPYSAYVRADPAPGRGHYLLEARTIPECVRLALQNLPSDTVSLGHRPVLDAFETRESNSGKKIWQYVLADSYQWLSLAEADARIEALSASLLTYGVQFQEPVLMFAESRLEWMLCAQALFRIGAIVVTLYPSLGRKGIVHGINQTQVRRIITTGDLLPSIGQFISDTPLVKDIIVIEVHRRLMAADPPVGVQLQTVRMTALSRLPAGNLRQAGAEPGPDHTAIILYTSGSTGDPKGVVLTHRNVVSAVQAGFRALAPTLTENGAQHTYYAILPLAHSYELAVELIMFSSGLRIGYGSRHTMLDRSPGVAPGCRGDLATLKPTVMAAVPLLMNRLRKALVDRFEQRKSLFWSQLLGFLVQYRTEWLERGFDTPIMNRLVCRPFKESLGGQLQYVICGGAPLSPDTQRMLRAVLNIHIMVGYGSTETSAASCMMDFEDRDLGHVGYPLHGIRARLEDWPEAGYTVHDRPRPRGLLVIGGPSVARGYFQLPEVTQSTFESRDGCRWVQTGDVAEVSATGAFRIIDRKKDLVKLQYGEYVALGKVETELKASSLVDEICLHADPMCSFLVALVLPNRVAISRLAAELDKAGLSWPELCADPQLEARVLTELRSVAAAAGLLEMETPKRIKLCPDEWTVEGGHFTPTMKINRRNLHKFYERDIEHLYAQPPH